MAKFMLSLREENFQLLINEAQGRGITIQELIRAVIIPDWVKQVSVVKASPNGGPSISRHGDGNGRESIIQPLNRVKRFGSNNYSGQI